ncbi:Citrinin biosynthesis transcriptional activator mrl3 [Pseudocercospora fuligena]|uniref:Citrinin biosynthesis transcriptional activator mrl3 n=1 Tax=Pseudocercospora fuligena TaxID=685502 RepID=A0A8H6REK3_9PEZI|nr:Citrinin biosynthesis transcriptional activator mrl3 [Pseudocercospora fuligena]
MVKRKPGPSTSGNSKTKVTKSVTTTNAVPEVSTQATSSHDQVQDLLGTIPSCSAEAQTAMLGTANLQTDVFGLTSAAMQLPSPQTSLLSGTTSQFHTPVDVTAEPILQLDALLIQDATRTFFDLVHPSIPLFDQDIALRQIANGTMNRALSSVMAAIALATAPYGNEAHAQTARTYLDELLTTCKHLESELQSNIGVEALQKSCLLAYYSFHQAPGQQAWMRIGMVARKAYAMGLHQLDFALLDSKSPAALQTSEHNDDLRRLWWVVFCLDSYTNITAGTPFIVEIESIATALLLHSSNTQGPIFLATDVKEVWETAQELWSRADIDHFALHVVVTVLMKESCKLFRMQIQRPDKRRRARVAAMRDHFATTRFALPAYYLQTTRVAFGAESPSAYIARLTNIVIFSAAQMILELAEAVDPTRVADQEPWSRAVEHCGTIVEVIKSWSVDSMTRVDPAMCFLIAISLSVLHVYSLCETSLTIESREQLERHEQILILFLQQFSAHWYTPRFLLGQYQSCVIFSITCTDYRAIDSFSKLKTLLATQMSYADARHVMTLYYGQLHQRNPNRVEAVASQEHVVPSFQTDTSWLDDFDMGDMSLINGFFGFDSMGIV